MSKTTLSVNYIGLETAPDLPVFIAVNEYAGKVVHTNYIRPVIFKSCSFVFTQTWN